MSRDLIEHGLGWSWTAPRVTRCIRSVDTNVVLAREGSRLAGFAIMKYGDVEAHLLLLAVRPEAQGRGVGSALVRWLEATALVAGIGQVMLEARASNEAARAFYKRLGYVEAQTVPHYYQGREPAVRLGRDLWADAPQGHEGAPRGRWES